MHQSDPIPAISFIMPHATCAMGLYLAAILVLGAVGMAAAQDADTLVVLHTEQGPLVIEFFPEDAPNHVDNFVTLTSTGFYDNTLFHRIISDFMIQGGDPNTVSGDPQTWGVGGPPTTVDAEFNNIMHNRGIVSMARSASPDSAGSQFFVVHKDSNFLDGQYTVFGRLVTMESYNTLDAIAATSTGPNDRPVEPEMVRIIRAEVITRQAAVSSGMELLEQDPPARIDETIITPVDNNYTNEELNFSIQFPAGWVVQPIGEDVLGVVAVSPIPAPIPTHMTISLENASSKALEEVVDEKMADLQNIIDSGELQILQQETIQLGQRQAFVLDAMQPFPTTVGVIDVRFKEITTIDNHSDMIYTFLLAGIDEHFDDTVDLFDTAVQSFDTLEKPEPAAGGGCLIATAAFGTEMAPQVQRLREIRDEHLMQTETGTAFVSGFSTVYYSFSPIIADYQRENPIFAEMTRYAITPALESLSILEHVSLHTEQDVLLYGSLALLLITISYAGPPALLALGIRRTTTKNRLLH